MTVLDTILDTIGGTTLLPLRRIVPPDSARILLKLECQNPSGSMKDRMALAMVEAAESDGRLRPGGSVVEYTGGSTGVSLSLVCAAKGLPLQIVTSDAFSQEKRSHMAALGAHLTLIPSPTGGTTKVSAFVQMVGTCGSLRGVSTRLRTHNESAYVVAVEPAESPLLSGGTGGSHRIEGTGPGFVMPLWSEGLADEIQTVSSDEAMAMARRLAREEGVFAGTSTGGNVTVALRVAARLGPGHTVVTIAVDSGMKYLSTPLYASST